MINKNVIILVTILIISCNEGGDSNVEWSEEDIKSAMIDCKYRGSIEQCECFVKKLQVKYNSWSHYINYMNPESWEEDMQELEEWDHQSYKECGFEF